jgi:hypothetical protein
MIPPSCSILSKLCSAYGALSEEVRRNIKKAVKEFLRYHLPDTWQSCMVVPIEGNYPTYCIPQDLFSEFKRWAAIDLPRLYPEFILDNAASKWGQ